MFKMIRRKAPEAQPRRPIVDVEKTSETAIFSARQRTIKLLMDLRPEAQKNRSPGPSKVLYRLERIWKKAWIRRVALVGLPVLLLGFASYKIATNSDVHAYIGARYDDVVAALATRPEFAIRGYRIAGASAPLSVAINETVDVPEGASTLTFEVASVQSAVSEIPAVRRANVTLGADGILTIKVVERVPQALWRDAEGHLWQIDRDGIALDPVAERADHPDLPVLIGEDVPRTAAEGMEIFAAVPDLHPRLRALVRVGARRWDVVLDRNLRIMLPENAPAKALSRVMAWHYGDEVLDRGLSAIDMRVPDRPALRMIPEAAEILRIREALTAAGEET